MDYFVNGHSANRNTPARTTIHGATCPCVSLGNPKKWRAFATFGEAMEWARGTGYRVNLCDWCQPG